MSQHFLSSLSLARLVGVHPDLVRVVNRAIEITRQDFRVHEGVRTREQALTNAASGAGIENSLHIPQADGYSHAADLYPVPLDWKNTKAFESVAEAMYQAADELGVLVQWGADWDEDGVVGEKGEWDYPHFQLPNLPKRIEGARVARIRRMGERAGGEERVL